MKFSFLSIKKVDFSSRFFRVLNFLLITVFITHFNQTKSQVPSNIPNLKLWLKSDTGVVLNGINVSSWKDQSGNSLNAYQINSVNQPSYTGNMLNGKPAIHFNGSQILNGVVIPSLSSSSLSIFIIASGNAMTSTFNILFDIGPYANGGLWLCSYQNKFTIYNQNTYYSSSTASLYSSGFNPTIFEYKKNINTLSESFLNTQYTSSSTNSFVNFAYFDGAYNIGGDPTYSGLWNGDVFEIIIFDRVISNAEETSINNYLIKKYSPALNLGPDISINPTNGCTPSNSVAIQANPDFQSYLWSNGSTANQINVNQYGEYSIICSDIFGINHYDTIKVIPTPKNFNYPANNTLCGTGSITWNTQLNKSANQFQWQDNSTDSLIIITNPGTYHVIITDTLGCVYNSNTLTIIQDNFSNTASLGPDLSLCAGNSISLVSGATPSLTYTWSTGSNNDSLLINNSGQYSVVVTNTNNCVAKDTINVTITGLAPVANFTSSIGCKNNAVSFTDLSVPPSGNTIDSYLWNFGDALSASNTSTLSNPFHTFTDTGYYSVKLKVITNIGCEQSIIKTIHIAPKPTINFTAGLSCQNDSTLFSSSTVNPTNYSTSSLKWNFGDPSSGAANTSTVSAPKHLFSNAANYTITLTATNNTGCKDSLRNIIAVKSQVKANFNYSSACTNTTTVFQDNSIVPAPNTTNIRSWNFGTSIASGLTVSKNYTNPGVYSVTLSVTGNNGCNSSITKIITVFDSPVASFIASPFCAKDTIAVLNTSTAQSGIISSNIWKLNNTYFSSIPSPSLSTSTAGSFPLKLTVTNSFGCKDSVSNNITVYPLPNIDFTTNPSSYYYLNSPISFIPNITNANSYLWNIAGITSSTLQSPSATFSNTGTYSVSLFIKDQQGCKNSVTKNLLVTKRFLDVAILNVVSSKDIDGFMSIQTDIANYGTIPASNLELNYHVSDGGNIKETWTGNLIPNAVFTYTFSSKTATQINSTNNITCVDIKKVNSITDENIENNTLCSSLNTDAISVSNPIPNPTNTDISLPIILNKDMNITISVYNTTGQLICKEMIQKGITGLNFITLPSSNYARGCYIIKTVIDDKIFIKKFIKISNE